MARRAPNPHLAALLAEAHWSATELARTVNALGAAQGLALRYDRTAVAHWLTGSRPRRPIPDLVASAFSRRCRRLITAHDTGLTQTAQPKDSRIRHPHEEGQAVERVTALCRAETDPARRFFITSRVYNLSAVSGTFLWKPIPPTPTVPSVRPLTAADVQTQREMVSLFADLTERYGGAHGRAALLAHLADTMGPLLIMRADSAALRRALFTSAAQLTHLLARMTIDAGHPGLAQRYFTTALGLAREADDRRLYAITLRAMSLQALNLEHPQQAHHLAEAAIEAAGPRPPSATHAFLLSQRALTHAIQHQRHAALTDLAAAEKHLARADSQCSPFSHYPQAGLDYQRAQTLLALGDPIQATRALLSAVQTRPDTHRRASALTHARLAQTFMKAGCLEASLPHWHAFLEHYPYLHSAPVTQALAHLCAALRPHQHRPGAAAVLRQALPFHALSQPALNQRTSGHTLAATKCRAQNGHPIGPNQE